MAEKDAHWALEERRFKRMTRLRMLGVMVAYGVLIGVFQPGMLEATAWFHIEVAIQFALLLPFFVITLAIDERLWRLVLGFFLVLIGGLLLGLSWKVWMWFSVRASEPATEIPALIGLIETLWDFDVWGSEVRLRGTLAQIWSELGPVSYSLFAASVLLFIVAVIVDQRYKRWMKQVSAATQKAVETSKETAAEPSHPLDDLYYEAGGTGLTYAVMLLVVGLIVAALSLPGVFLLKLLRPDQPLGDLLPMGWAMLIGARMMVEFFASEWAQFPGPQTEEATPDEEVEDAQSTEERIGEDERDLQADGQPAAMDEDAVADAPVQGESLPEDDQQDWW